MKAIKKQGEPAALKDWKRGMQQGAPGKSLDYANMAACWPDNGGNVTSGYGAPLKAGAAVKLNEDFVSPHAPGCEERFVYDASGAVRPRGEDAAVQGTIDRVQLGHDRLCELRRSAAQAEGLVLSSRGMRSQRRLISAAQAKRFAIEVLKPDANGALRPFCVALSQIALKYAEQEEKRSQRLRSGRGGKAGE